MRRRPLLVLITTVALLAASCGGSSDASSGGDPQPSTTGAIDETGADELLTGTTAEPPAEETSTTSTEPPESTTTEPDAGDLDRAGDVLGTAGDPLFPLLGNSGYDVATYNLSIDLTGEEFAAEATIDLRAQQDLEKFHLDLVGLLVDEIRIDDEPATFTRDSRELIIRPALPLERGELYTVYIAYRGVPQPVLQPGVPAPLGWNTADWGTYVVSEPLGAATWFPANDHPTDKAIFTISATVPEGQVAAGPGKLTSVVSAPDNGGPDGSNTFTWTSTDPMATYLASLVTGDFVLSEPFDSNGVEIRHAVHRSLPERVTTELETTDEMLTAFIEQFGPYPFEAYGVVVIPESLGYALENQTLSIFGQDIMTSVEAQPILAHELAHQWYGNHVSLQEWDDIWLNEGFATWAEFWWRDRLAGPPSDFFELVKDIPLDPLQPIPADELFDANVYLRGGLTLETYERTVGEEAFRDFLLEWSNRYGGGTASNEQFLALVEELHGPEVAVLLNAWIEDQVAPKLVE